MIPYGGPVYRPPTYDVRPPRRDGETNLTRVLVLVGLFILFMSLFISERVLLGFLALALWYTVKRLWKIR